MAAQIKNYSADSTGLITPFGPPVLIAEAPKFEDMNPHLVDIVRRTQSAEHGASAKEYGSWHEGAWHSMRVLAKLDDSIVQELLSWVRQEVHKLTLQLQPDWFWLNPDGWRIEAWSNVYPSGTALGSHHHAEELRGGDTYSPIWGGVYYIDIDDSADAGGETVLEGKSLVPATLEYQPDPFDQEFTIQPKAGHLVVFPSWLNHHVRDYHGKRDRITVGINFYHPDIAVHHHAGIVVHRIWPLVIRPKTVDWMQRNFPGVFRMLRHGTLWYRQRFGGSSAT